MSDDDDVRARFDEAVNMTASELEDWLATNASKEAGQKDGGGESVGHESGRRIVAILRKRKDELTDGDREHMRKVAGYVSRHRAQRPDKGAGELEDTRWAHSLKNWGHDPTK